MTRNSETLFLQPRTKHFTASDVVKRKRPGLYSQLPSGFTAYDAASGNNHRKREGVIQFCSNYESACRINLFNRRNQCHENA